MHDVDLRKRGISFEVLRTAIVLANENSHSEAARRLGISVAAVSIHIRRLENAIGNSIFVQRESSVEPSDLGNRVLSLARRIVEQHDQLLSLRPDRTMDGPTYRLGLSPLLVGRFMKSPFASELLKVCVIADRSDHLESALLDGQLDAACCLSIGDTSENLAPYIVAESEDDLVWVRSKNFSLTPGMPLPIVTWRGENWITTALVRHGLDFKIVFDGEDFQAKRAAVEAGQGLTALPRRFVPSTLTRAEEPYLPPLPVIRTVLFARPRRSPQLASLVDGIRLAI